MPFLNGHIGSYDSIFGRFPPERRYNIDQIPMPFIVEQSDTYIGEDDEHVRVQGTGSEGLTKRQYTVHVFINAGDTPENTHGYVDIICHGKGTRISRIEKDSYNPLINVRCQNKAWVDREVMLEIARTFA